MVVSSGIASLCFLGACLLSYNFGGLIRDTLTDESTDRKSISKYLPALAGRYGLEPRGCPEPGLNILHTVCITPAVQTDSNSHTIPTRLSTVLKAFATYLTALLAAALWLPSDPAVGHQRPCHLDYHHLSRSDSSFSQADGFTSFAGANKKNPTDRSDGFSNRCLAMSYSRMGRPHTTIGDRSFHC